jgi:ABC-type nitrate/sulfonate/bicarbonate transport system permease component
VTSIAAAPSRRGLRLNPRLAYGALSLGILAAIWELAVLTGVVDARYLAAPSAAAAAGWELVADGSFWGHAWASLIEFFWGTLIGVVVGVVLGFMMARWSTVNAAIGPTVWAIYAVPRTAFVPVLLVWFGIGLESKVALVFLGVVLPMIANTYLGVRETDPYVLRAARAFAANGREILTKVIFPSSIPYLIDGLRLGTGRGIIGVIIAELYASQEGIGYLLRQAGLNFETDRMIFGVILVGAFGIVLSQALIWLERRLAGWRRAGTATE